MIQSLENFVSMAIQGTQVSMYTNTHYFCIFLIFQFFLNFLLKKKLKKKKKKQKNKKNMLNKAMYKTKLT